MRAGCGCVAFARSLAVESAVGYVAAAELAVERNRVGARVSAVYRLAQRFSEPRRRQHPAASRLHAPVLRPLRPAVENYAALLRRLVKADNILALLVRPWIPGRRQYHGRRAFRTDDDILFGKASRRRVQQRTRKHAAQARQHDLRLRVSETSVELYHLDRRGSLALLHHHKSGVENAAIDDAASAEFAYHRQDNLFLDEGQQIIRDDGRRRICAHAAGVRALVAVERPLVVLRTRQQHRRFAVRKSQYRALLAVEEFFEQDLGAGGAEFVGDKHIVDCSLRRLARFGDDHALARRQAVRLDDHGKAEGR